MKFRLPKIISLILAFVLIISSGACLQSFAEEDFDEVVERTYSQTIQDLLNGEEVEFEYYGHPMTYDLAVIDAIIDAQRENGTGGGDASIEFDSGRKADGYPTHQRIAANALAILLHDKGTSLFDTAYYFSSSDSFVNSNVGANGKTYADYIVYHSASPDENETGLYDGIDEETGKTVYKDDTLSIKIGGMTYSFVMFSGHFYDPYTEKNWKDSTEDTCKTNAVRHYNAAKNLYLEGKYADAFEELGRGMHYVQDACQTQHANNLTAKDDGDGLTGYMNGLDAEKNRHGKFEKDIDIYIRNHMPFRTKLQNSQNVFDNSIYNEALQLSVENIVRNNDYASYVLIDKSNYMEMLDKDHPYDHDYNVDYYDSATAQFKNATMASVQYLYHFANDVGITFSK